MRFFKDEFEIFKIEIKGDECRMYKTKETEKETAFRMFPNCIFDIAELSNNIDCWLEAGYREVLGRVDSDGIFTELKSRFFKCEDYVYRLEITDKNECLVYSSHVTDKGVVIQKLPIRIFTPFMLADVITEWHSAGYREVFGMIDEDGIFTEIVPDHHTFDLNKLKNRDSFWF